MILDLTKTDTGRILVSIILGLGLAALFRRVCNKGQCVVIRGPSTDSVQKYQFKIKDDCYKYTPYVVDCADATKDGTITVQEQ